MQQGSHTQPGVDNHHDVAQVGIIIHVNFFEIIQKKPFVEIASFFFIAT
jgi:hypothetical protein